MKSLALRGTSIADSRTLAINAMAKKMKKEGLDVVNLTVGEPDFPTPDNIKEAAFKAINANFTKYTAPDGIEDLKMAVVNKYKADFGVEYTPECVVISSGAKHALTNALMATCEKGDEVIVPTPSWVSYPELVKLTEAVPVMLYAGADKGFKADAAMIRKAITPKTKALMICSPSNPTGAVYTHDELSAIADLVKEFDLFLIYDEIYEKLIYEGLKHVSMCIFPQIRDQLILINGVSKSYAMTGWRIGYSISHKSIAVVIKKLQSQMTSACNSIAQKAAVEAIGGSQVEVENMRKIFDARRIAGYERIKKMPGVKILMPQGAFYLYADFSNYFGKKYQDKVITNNDDICEYFLKELLVASVSGSAFGSDEHVRFSYACSETEFLKGMNRIENGLAKLT